MKRFSFDYLATIILIVGLRASAWCQAAPKPSEALLPAALTAAQQRSLGLLPSSFTFTADQNTSEPSQKQKVSPKGEVQPPEDPEAFVFSTQLPLAWYDQDYFKYAAAFAEMTFTNYAISAVNTRWFGANFSQVDASTMLSNLQSPWVWDNDVFITNELGHTYQGALYFDEARGNNINFYYSALYSFAGSWGWETFMENNPPSLNDMMRTGISSDVMGEALYRMAGLLLDRSDTSGMRFLREIGALLISPGAALADMMSGDMFSVDQDFHVNPPYQAFLSTGMRATGGLLSDSSGNKEQDNGRAGFGIELNMFYGDGLVTSFTPFDAFHFFTEASFYGTGFTDAFGSPSFPKNWRFGTAQASANVDIEGDLFNYALHAAPNLSDSIGMNAQINYFDNRQSAFSDFSVGQQYEALHNLSGKGEPEGSATLRLKEYANVVLFGVGDYDIEEFDGVDLPGSSTTSSGEMPLRNYNMGLNTKAYFDVGWHSNRLHTSLMVSHYTLFGIKNIFDNENDFNFQQLFQGRFAENVQLYRALGFMFGAELYESRSYYPDGYSVKSLSWGAITQLSVSF